MQKRSNQNVDVPYKVDNCMDHVDRNYELFHKRTKTDMQSYHCPATMTSSERMLVPVLSLAARLLCLYQSYFCLASLLFFFSMGAAPPESLGLVPSRRSVQGIRKADALLLIVSGVAVLYKQCSCFALA